MSEHGLKRWSRSLIFRVPLGILLLVMGYEVGYAASVSLVGQTLGEGSAAVQSCDSDGFSFDFTSDGLGAINTVNVTGIAGACAGGTLRVTLVDGAASVGAGTASLPASGFHGTASVAIGGPAVIGSVTSVRAVIEGP
jgi:hypothetical protein